MIKVLMVLFYLNSSTGAVEHWEMTGESFNSLTKCNDAAISKGVQKTKDGQVKLYVCVIEKTQV